MKFELRPYQIECVNKVLKELETKKKVGIIAPTGSGKTEMFCSITSKFIQNNKNKYVLVLSHLSILTIQTKKRFKKRFPKLKVGILQAQKVPQANCDVIISTMQTAKKKSKFDNWSRQREIFSKNERECGLIIIDEAHMLTTDSYDKVLKQFPDSKVIGCTATPYRSAQLMTNWFDNIAYSISIKDLIENGYLVEPKLKQIIMDNCEGSQERMARVIDIYKKEENGKQALVFLKTIEESKEMTTAFRDQRILCSTVTSDMSDKDRDEIIEKFHKKEIKILTTCNVLSLGFDSPPLEVIFLPYATKSPTLYLQRIGRALRPYKGKKDARIYVLGDAPSVKRGMYEKVQDLILLGGRVDKNKKALTVYDELEYLELTNDTASEEYRYTMKIVNIADRVKQLGNVSLHKLISNQTFPSRFLRNSSMFMSSLPCMVQKFSSDSDPMTEKQKQVLTYAGFTEAQLKEMNKGAASIMISTINNMRTKALENSSDIISSGKFMGRRVKDLPNYYKQWCLRNAPNSIVSRQIKNYEKTK